MLSNETQSEARNDLQLDGIEFVEFASPDPQALHRLFLEFGFSRVKGHGSHKVDLYEQNAIRFLLNREPGSAAARFSGLHGPSICSMGWRVKDADRALQIALERGAKRCEHGDYLTSDGRQLPAIYGIGDSIIYFVEEDPDNPSRYEELGFESLFKPDLVEQKGFLAIDHLTNNVPYGEMKKWADFYKGIFGFTEVRYFDIRGVKTGLQSYALRSPCGKFCIPINEATEHESQINEYLREYKGPGIQHLAFLTEDIIGSLEKLSGTSIETLDIDDEYYEEVFKRVPGVTEDKALLRKLNVLVDGDRDGYLLQIFTKNIIGPIFIEIIQRKNHFSFGEGNFQALFRSIERDQMKRGVFGAEERRACAGCHNCECDSSKASQPALRHFTSQEHETWRQLFERQQPRRSEQIVDWFSDGLGLLGITKERVPDLGKVNAALERLTGFKGVPVEGLESSAHFYPMLARREFPIGNFIREARDLAYTPAPDVFHDLYGHLPFLAKPEYADFCHDFGVRACRYLSEPALLRQFDRLFWFTIEFALVETARGRRIFGAGIASSFAECRYALSDEPEVRPFDLEAIRSQEFKIDDFQRRIFVLQDERQLYRCLDDFEAKLAGSQRKALVS